MSRHSRREYFLSIYGRYRRADRKLKQVILNEFCANTGYHRKYAIRMLNGPPPSRVRPCPRRPRSPSYGPGVMAVLAAVWEAAGYPWSVRLKALVPLWMPWVKRRFRVSAEVERQLRSISARQIDRRLRARKQRLKRRRYGRTQPGALLKHQIAIKTDSWDVKVPGFTEVDLVSHSGNAASGEFAHSLNVTDIHTTWTETRAVLGKGETAVRDALEEISTALPFRLLGIDSDNGSEFINWHLGRWCARRDIQFTRGRPYKKDDNAHIEQKNWTHVRKLLGWDRYDTPAAVEAMNDLYGHELRLWMNLFLPSVKLIRKSRVGSKLRRLYGPAQTPLDRLLASPGVDRERAAELQTLRRRLDPFALAQTIDRKLEQIHALADRRLSPKAPNSSQSSVTF
ncbi:MAG TPA: integrase [Terriglobia bacterium]|nr:integrase [Terriglobia bacterium]